MALTGFSGTNTNKATDPLKKPVVNLQPVQPGQALQLAPSAVQQPAPAPAPQQTTATQGAGQVFNAATTTDVMKAAQNKALQGTQVGTSNLVTQKTQQLLNDPSQGRDPQQYQASQLDALARRQAADLEKQRQMTGGTANLGVNVQDLLATQLANRQETTDTTQKLRAEEENRRQQEGLAALAAGQQTSQLEQQLQTGEIDNLLATSQGALGFAELQNKGDTLISQQEFQATQAQLDKDFQEAMTKGDYAQANQLALMKNQFEEKMQQNEQEWKSAENLAQNAFSQNMQMDQNEFSKAMQYINAELDQAAADSDFEKQKLLMDKTFELETQQQLQNFNHDEKMTVLDSEIAQAVADNDFEKQMQLMKFQDGLEVARIEDEQDFTESMKYLDNKLTQALAEGDFNYASQLNQQQYDHQMSMHLDNLELDKMKVDLQQQGIDMAQIEQQYNILQAEIAAGRVDPASSVEYLQEALGSQLPDGYEFKAADPLATQKALKEDYLNQQYQYALAQGINPDGSLNGAVYDETGKFAGLDETLGGAFNDHLKSTLYGQTGTPEQANIISLKNGDIPLDQITPTQIDYLLNDVSVPKVNTADYAHFAEQETGSGSESRRIFPELEGNGFVNVGGVLYKVDGHTIDDQAGDDDTVYNLTNVMDGSSKTIVAAKNGDDKIKNNFFG